MEPLSSFDETYSSEEADFMSHLLGNFSAKLPSFQDSCAFWPHHEPVSDNRNGNMLFLLQENSYTDGDNTSVFFPTSSEESNISVSCSSGGRKGVSVIPTSIMKHSCSLEDVHTSWKKPKLSKSEVNIDAVGQDVDNESNRLQDGSRRPKGVALNTNGKKRASNGSATDSQSIYAKKRRERINERLKILQNLVPNGTKVDISTMLEEAVQYVKFLQLQIKLLSSDDLWMYAPLAYNGLNLGLDVMLPLPR